MKELINKKASAEIDFDINLSITYDDVHGEPVTVEDVEALDFLERIGYEEIVMQKIWGNIADNYYYGMFDVEYDCGCYVSVEWDISNNAFTVSFNDCYDWITLRCKEFDEEFNGIFGAMIDNVSCHVQEKWHYLSFYWEEEIDLDDYPNIINKIEKAGA